MLFLKYSDSILLPKIIKIDTNLFAIVFKNMKLLPAKNIIAHAMKRGDIGKDYTIVDTSSGNFALGMAIICAELQLPFKIFGDPAIDKSLLQQLQFLGGNVHFSKSPKNPGAYQKLRLNALKNYLSREKLSYWMNQYDNPDNFQAYAIVAEQIKNTIDHPNINIVGSVGSGGSTCGIIKALRSYCSSAKLIGVDTFNSVLFGMHDGKRILRGLGNSILPKNLDHNCYDEVHWVSANDTFFYTHELLKNKALFCGPTSGAAYQVAKYLAQKYSHETFAFIAPDEGYRYSASTYNKSWLKKQNFYNHVVTETPTEASYPLDAIEPWAYIKWDRRSYNAVIRHNGQ